MSKRRGRRNPAQPATRSFWGDTREREGSATPKTIRPTPDPAALVRSLGNPPLSPATAADHLAVVYEEAVRAATALAAANGLLDLEDTETGTSEY